MKRVTKILKVQAQQSAIERATDQYQMRLSPTFLPALRILGRWRSSEILGTPDV